MKVIEEDLFKVNDMTKEEKISELVEILKHNFNSVYCDTCRGIFCEDCYRKYMHWEVSDEFAKLVAQEILDKLK